MSILCGVANNDAPYTVKLSENVPQPCGKIKRVQTWICPYYAKWRDMVSRCYSKGTHTYEGCSVCESWLTFSNFRAWMVEQEWKGLHLDKDILFEGNKIYSPSCCSFVTQAINSFFTDSLATRGTLMIGVTSYSGKKVCYVARCNNPFNRSSSNYLGVFDTELEAHLSWKNQKHKYAIKLAEDIIDPLIKEALTRRWL